MLDLFRKRGLTAIIYPIIVAAMVLVFVVEFGPASGKKRASLSQSCAAVVKGWCIDPKDFMASFRLLVPREDDGMRKANQMGLRKLALDGLIERELLVSEAQRLGLTVSDDELTDSIFNGFIHVSIPSDNLSIGYQLGIRDGKVYAGFRDPKTKIFDEKIYTRTIRNLLNRSPIEFREEQGRELLAAKMRDLVRAPVRVSEIEALESYVGERSSATLESVTVSADYAARYAVHASDAEIAKWAAEADNAKQIDELVAARKGEAAPKPNHVRHILIKVAPEATADEKGVALSKLSEAAARIKNGESFAEVARTVSHDTGSASRGGDVGDDMSMMVTPFRKAGDALKPGETSPAVETMFGYHLLTKDDPSKSSEVEAAVKKSVTRELFYRVKGVEAAKELASKIHTSMKEGKDAEEAIRAAIAPLKRTGPSAPALFLVRDPGEEATPPAPESNDDADAGASSTTTTSAATHGADAGAPNKPAPPPVIAKDATPETDPDRPKLEASSAFNRGGQPLPSLSPDGAQKVLAFSFEAKAGELMPEPLRTDDSFVIVRLKEQKSATKEEFEKERETYLQTLLAAKQAEALALYVRRLRDAAKSEIKIEQTYLVDPASRDGGAPGEDEEF